MTFEYKAFITDVYDGDTVTADIDLGFGIWKCGEKLRLFGIDAPEVRGDSREAGIVSRDYLRSLILDQHVIIQSHKDEQGKYGRYLATIILEDAIINEDSNIRENVNINDHLVLSGHAVYRKY